MYDMHCHLLPFVDDGADSIEDAVNMAKIAYDNGIRGIIATPHYIEGEICEDRERYVCIVEEVREALEYKGIDIELYLGNEIYITSNVVRLIEEGKVNRLNDSRYVLLELPMFDIPQYVEEIIYSIALKGFVPVIAHPERNIKIMEDQNILYRYIELGALAQMNLPSIEGKYGDRIRDTAEILLTHNMIHMVGTDAHSSRRRTPRVKRAIEKMDEILGKEITNTLTVKNPLKVINDEYIEIVQPIKYDSQKGFKKVFKFLIGSFFA